jgi:hypothetical protein
MTIGSHQRTIGKSQVHLTPRWILDPLGEFFFDPCASSPRPWNIGSEVNYTEADDGLSKLWPKGKRGYLNPPFHRYKIANWLRRMGEHGRGIALVHARTETDWFRIIKESATALFFLDRRVVFLDALGQQQKITSPTSKYFGKVANSGAPVMLAAYGFDDADLLAGMPSYSEQKDTLAGLFVPLVISRSVLVAALRDHSWRDLVIEFLTGVSAPVSVADLYHAFADHPKTRSNPHWKEKLRQTLQRGAGRRVSRDQWVAA